MQYLVKASFEPSIYACQLTFHDSFDTAIHPVLTLCGHLFW